MSVPISSALLFSTRCNFMLRSAMAQADSHASGRSQQATSKTADKSGGKVGRQAKRQDAATSGHVAHQQDRLQGSTERLLAELSL